MIDWPHAEQLPEVAGLVSKFTFEVMTTKLSQQMNPRVWQAVAESCGI